jgi:hypothetical protein
MSKIVTRIATDFLEGHVLEYGQFRSVRSRLEMLWSKNLGHRYQRKIKASMKQLPEPRLKTSECCRKKPVDNHRNKLKAAIKEVLDFIDRPMPGRYRSRRDMYVVFTCTMKHRNERLDCFFLFSFQIYQTSQIFLLP